MMRRIPLLLPVLGLVGCAVQPPRAPRPEPVYESVQATPDVVFEAALDWLLERDVDFDFVESRAARVEVLVSAHQFAQRDTAAPAYADCGKDGHGDLAGRHDLRAAVGIQVRSAPDGSGVLKVVVPAMWQANPDGRILHYCVSKGRLEREIREAIRSRIRPQTTRVAG